MSVVAICMAKDEADIIGSTVGHMLSQVDDVWVFDNDSSDDTAEICRTLGARVEADSNPAYYQSRKMSAWAEQAVRAGYEWVVPFDADEVWVGRNGTVSRTLERLPGWVLVAEADLYDHVATGRDDPGLGPVERLRWRRPHPGVLPKVACRARSGMTIHQGNHGVTFAKDTKPPIVKHLLTVRHFPYRSPDQLIRKARNGAAAYGATRLPETVGQHWRGYGRMSNGDLADHFHKWFFREDPSVEYRVDGEVQPALVEDPISLGG